MPKNLTDKQKKFWGLLVLTIFFFLIGAWFFGIAVLFYLLKDYKEEIQYYLQKLQSGNLQFKFPDVDKNKSNINLSGLSNMNVPKFLKWAVPLFVIVVFALMVITSSYVIIENGTVGVVTRFGAVQEKVMKPGLNFKVPFADHVLIYNTQKVIYETSQSPRDSLADYVDYPIETTTEDGQQIQVTYSVRFSVDPDKVTWLANNLGTEQQIVEKVVKTDTRINTRNVPRQYKAIDLYTGNIQDVSAQIAETLRPLFDANGIILDEFGIRNVVFSAEYVDAIESKQIEAEKIVTEQNIAEQEVYKKQAAITKAEGDAEAQALQQQTLTTPLLQKMWIEKWNGQLPTYQGDSTPLIQLPQ